MRSGDERLLDLAKHERCQIRVPGICSHDPEKTVPCHIRMVGISGMGKRAPPILVAWGCYDCHEVCDGRRMVDGISKQQAELYLLQGMARTIYELNRRGHLKYEF